MKQNKIGVEIMKEFGINGKHTAAGIATTDEAFKGFMLYEIREIKETAKDFRNETKRDIGNFRDEIKGEVKEIKNIFNEHCKEDTEIFKGLTKEVNELRMFKSNVYIVASIISITFSLIAALMF